MENVILKEKRYKEVNLSEQETESFLKLASIRLSNLKYEIYYTGDEYIYNGKEELIGIKLSGDLKDEVMIFDTYSFLPIDINVNHINGSQIEFCHKQPYMNFFKQVSDYIHYYSYFE